MMLSLPCRYLTLDELTKLIAPPAQAQAIVSQWLNQEALNLQQESGEKMEWEWTINRDYVFLKLPAHKAEELFQVQLSLYQGKNKGKFSVSVRKSFICRNFPFK